MLWTLGGNHCDMQERAFLILHLQDLTIYLHDCVRNRKCFVDNCLRQHPRSHNDNSVMHVIALEFGKYKGMDFFIFFD